MAGLLGNYNLATAIRSSMADGLRFSPRSRRREAWGAWGGPGSDRARISAEVGPRAVGAVPTYQGPAALPRYTHHRVGQAALLELSWRWVGELRRVSGGPPKAWFCPQLLHLHLPHILVPLAFHAPQLRHALLQAGCSVAVLHLIVLAAVLGEGGERKETPMSKSSRLRVHGSEHWTGPRGAQLGTWIAWGQSMPSAGLGVLIH